jgi:hypothetical protein
MSLQSFGNARPQTMMTYDPRPKQKSEKKENKYHHLQDVLRGHSLLNSISESEIKETLKGSYS